MDTRLHCVYLLTSLDPSCSGDYYIGYTVNPLRRLRQHNGELVNGARQTRRRGRPWTIVCCVSGFSEDRAALKFEWCWQHPSASAKLKHSAPVLLRGLRKLPFAIGVLHLLVHAELFCRLELTLHIFETEMFANTRAAVAAHVMSTTVRRGDVVVVDAPARADNGDGDAGKCVGDASMRAPVVLPELMPTALFHVEEITRDVFERKYVAQEGGGASPLLESSSLCPYDLSALSQTVMEEWGGSEDGTCSIRSRGEREGDETLLGGDVDSDGCLRGDDDGNGDGDGDGDGGDDSLTERKPRRALSPPPPTSATAASPAGLPIPLRFKHFKEADFVREYEAEQTRMDACQAPCTACGLPLQAPYVMRCSRAPFCPLATHLGCLAMWALHGASARSSSCADQPREGGEEAASESAAAGRLVPSAPFACPLCSTALHWAALVKDLKRRAVAGERLRAHRRRQRMEHRLAQRLRHAGAATHRVRQGARAKRARSWSPPVSRRGVGSGGNTSPRVKPGTSTALAAVPDTDSVREGEDAAKGAGTEAACASWIQPSAPQRHPPARGGASPIDQLADTLLFM